ncbi:hypothetical protein NESM_000232200 [Novymonas esmeraldas]|uniref:Uncharacterized protein n=1 Tax=Novymonas esmeraldas TaxID=1808958 RepID=A0AAW0F5Y5_9TRYP
MILTKEELQTITLNAKSVHKYGDQAFFPAEISHAATRIGDQSFLNFFVRYHHRHAPERYLWSRVRRVVLLEDVMAADSTGTAAPPLVTSPTVEWRGKTFWICFAVEAVEPRGATTSPASSEAATTAEEEFVVLTQLSNTVPTDEEVLAFCVASADRRPTQVYVDGILGEAPVPPPVLPDAVANTEGESAVGPGEPASASTQPPASPDPRAFVPTPRQVELLRRYKKQHLTHHQWTEEEIEESKVLRQRYSSIGVAAAPVRTVAYVQQHRVEERKQQQQQQRQRHAEVAASQGYGATQRTEVDLTQEHGEAAAAESAGGVITATQTQHSSLSVVAPTSPSAAASPTDTPLSPFLPRGMLRAQQHQYQHQHQHHRSALVAPTAAASAFEHRVPAEDPSSTLVLGDGASLLQSQLSVSQTPPPPPVSQPPADAAVGLSQHLSQLRAAEDSFFHYISDEKRSAYLNRLADITKRNSDTNANNRRRGIANERRLERKGNLLESRGLWVTDDKERAGKAEDYVKAQAGESSSTANKKDESAAATAAAAAASSAVTRGGTTGDGADTGKSAEDSFVERFNAYRAAQSLSFAGCVTAGALEGGDGDDDDDLGRLLQTATAAAADTARSASHASAAAAAPAASGGFVRRLGQRLLPNRLRTEPGSPSLVLAQLVHRSTVRMAKRAREE